MPSRVGQRGIGLGLEPGQLFIVARIFELIKPAAIVAMRCKGPQLIVYGHASLNFGGSFDAPSLSLRLSTSLSNLSFSDRWQMATISVWELQLQYQKQHKLQLGLQLVRFCCSRGAGAINALSTAAVLVVIFICLWLCRFGEAILLEPNCGIRTMPSFHQMRIIGGSDAEITSHPWMAYLYNELNYFCAGTLITNRSGLPRSAGSMCQITAEDYSVSMVINHKYFTPSIMLNDIAMIRLARTVKFNDHIRPICIILDPAMRLLLEDGMTLTATGWGLTDNKMRPPALQDAPITVMNRYVCSKLYDVTITQGQICAGDKETNTCLGDSGGPLGGVVNYYGDLRFVQYGITSFGDSECHSPSIYTDLSTYSGWINMVVNQYRT
ncbi:GM24243 [Drosophila sechellia]|uniref:GM24243 n=1 Tax=Drosophila sechellia TaxID=7238 RepID=B4HLY6_DROSE|nr:GM24243 [Drosophila sechellia]